jgi:hypothetical protein
MNIEINKSLYETLTENLYKVEFNESKQHFHLSLYVKGLKDSNGSCKIYDCVSDFEFKIFKIFLQSNYKSPYTLENVLDASKIISKFHNELVNNNIDILPIK